MVDVSLPVARSVAAEMYTIGRELQKQWILQIHNLMNIWEEIIVLDVIILQLKGLALTIYWIWYVLTVAFLCQMQEWMEMLVGLFR